MPFISATTSGRGNSLEPRVALLFYRFPALSQTFVLDQIAHLRKAGFAVSVHALHLVKSGLLHPRARDAMQHARFADQHWLYRVFGSRIAPAAARSFVWARVKRAFLRRAASRNDVLLCHFGPNGLLAVKAIAGVEKPAAIWTIFHGYDVSSYPLQKGHQVYDPLFRAGQLFFPISQLWARRLVDLGCPPDRIRLLRMGVDCEAISYRPARPQVGAPFRVLSVGRLTEKKGAEYSLRALAEVARRRSDLAWSLDLVGDGPLEGDLRRLTYQLGIDARVKFHGALSSIKVRNLLREAHIFLLPSVTAADGDMEGIPVALMEAMAAGVPAVSTFHSGIPELIEHGRSGLLAREQDVAELSSHLEALMDDPTLHRDIAEAARMRVEEEFNQARINAEFADMIRTELRSPHSC